MGMKIEIYLFFSGSMSFISRHVMQKWYYYSQMLLWQANKSSYHWDILEIVSITNRSFPASVKHCTEAVADLHRKVPTIPSFLYCTRFPRRRAPTPKLGAPTYHLAKFSPENCMKMKEIEPEGRVPCAPLRSADGPWEVQGVCDVYYPYITTQNR